MSSIDADSICVHGVKIAYETDNDNNKYYHNSTLCVHQSDNTNITIRSEHMSTCKLCARQILCSNVSSGSVNSGEYDINGKTVVDKSRNVFGKTVTLGNNNDVLLSSNNNGDLLINDVKLFQSYVPTSTKQIDETQFCLNWKTPYVGKGIITGYVTSVGNNGQYQTIIDGAGNVSVSSDFGYSFSSQTNLTNGSSLGSVAMSDNGQYQLTMDFVGNVYQSTDYGKSWQSKAIYTVYDIIILEYVSVSVSQTGKYQIVCVNGKAYVSNDYGLSFKQLTSLDELTVFKKIIAKEGNYFDFTYNDLSGNFIVQDDQSAMFIALTYDLSGGRIGNNNLQISSIDSSGVILTNQDTNWVKLNDIHGIITSLAVSNNFMYKSIADISGNIYRSDTSGGLINNSFYENTSDMYQWSANIIQNLGLKEISDIAMDASGTYQTVITKDGWVFSSHNTNINGSGDWQETSGNWVSTRIPINDQSLLFLSVSENGSTQFTIDETGRIFRSDDYGVSWLGGTANSNFVDVACSESGKYATIIDSSGYIITTSSYGKIWGAPQKITPNLPDQGLIKVTMSTDGQYQYVISKYNIYQSLNYGKKWDVVNDIVANSNSAEFSTTLGSPIVLYAPLTNVAISGNGSVLTVLDSSHGISGGTKINSNEEYIYVCNNVRTTNDIAKSLNTYVVRSDASGGIAIGLTLSETGQYIAVSDYTQNVMFSNTYGQTWEPKTNHGDLGMNYLAMSKSGQTTSFLYGENPTLLTFTNNIGPSIDIMSNIHNGLFDFENFTNDKTCSALAVSNDSTYIAVCLSDGSGEMILTNTNTMKEWKTVLETDHELTGVAMSGNGKYIYTIDQIGNIYISDTFGESFSSTAKTTKYDIYKNKSFLSIDMSADGKVQSSFDFSGNIYVSTDTGVTWNDPINISNLIDSNYLPVKIKLSATGQIQYIIVLGNSTSYLLSSTDFGKTWGILYHSPDNEFIGLSTSASGQHITIGCFIGGVLVSHDYGETFKQIQVGENLEYQPIIDVSMSASGEYQAIVTLVSDFFDGVSITYVSSNFGTTWQVKTTDISTVTIGSAISISDSGQYQSCVGFNQETFKGYVSISSNYGQTFSTTLFPYQNELYHGETTLFPISISVSGSGKYQTILALTYNSSLILLYKSTDYGQTWNISETMPLVVLGKTFFGNYFSEYSFYMYIMFLLFTRFKVSSDGKYVAIAINDSIYLSHCPEVFDSTIVDTIDVTNNANVNSLTTKSLNVNGGFVAKTKIVKYDYNIELSDYIICCDTSGCIVRLPEDGFTGQTLIVTNGKNLLPFSVFSPNGGTFNGVNTPNYFGGLGMDTVTILCLGNNAWITISQYYAPV